MRRVACAVLGFLGLTFGACTPTERFVADGADSVRDTQTGLEWTHGDEVLYLPWRRAEAHCRQLSLGGHADWRLPSLDEVKSVYDEAENQACGDHTCHLVPLITLGGRFVWTSTARGQNARFYFDFVHGTSLSPTIRSTLLRSTHCVRGS